MMSGMNRKHTVHGYGNVTKELIIPREKGAGDVKMRVGGDNIHEVANWWGQHI